jgi:HK97 gp10 family phage protein
MARTSQQLARLNARMAAVPKAAREAVVPALDKSADELVGRMKSLAPVDEGDLQESIRKEAGDHELARRVFTDDFKARWKEFGTVTQPASPFFFPSYRLLRKRITNRITRAVGKAVKEHWRRP